MFESLSGNYEGEEGDEEEANKIRDEGNID